MFSKLQKIFSINTLRMLCLFILFIQFVPQIGYRIRGFYLLYRIMPYIYLLFFCVILIKDFLKNRDIWNNTGIDIQILFFIVYFISCILNFRYNFFDNIQLIFAMMLQMIIICFYDKGLNKTEIRNQLKSIGMLFVTLTFIAVLGSFIMFIYKYGDVITSMDGFNISSGFRSNRLFGLYHSVNYGSLYGVVSIIASIKFLSKSKKLIIKILLTFNIILQYLYIILSLSRTGAASLVLASFLIALWFLYNKIKINKFKFIITFMLSIMISVSLLVPFDFIKNIAENYLNNTNINSSFESGSKSNSKNEKPNKIIQVKNSESLNKNINETKQPTPEVSLDRKGELEKYGLTNGRLESYKDQLGLIFRDKPILGISYFGYFDYAKANYPNSFIVKKNKPYCENDIVALLVYSGIVGTAIMFIFIYKILKLIAVFILNKVKDYKREDLEEIYFPLVIIIIFFTTMMFSSAVFFQFSIESVLFWTLLGYIIYFVDPNPKESITKRIMDKIYFSFNCVIKRHNALGGKND